MSGAESILHDRPVYKRELLREAIDSQEPVTEVEEERGGSTVRIHAIQEYDGRAYRAAIRYDEFADNPPSVKFGSCQWDSDAEVCRDWTPLATGSLSGPQTLPAWESLFTVFNAALHAYHDEVGGRGD